MIQRASERWLVAAKFSERPLEQEALLTVEFVIGTRAE